MSTPKRKGPKAVIRELVAALEAMQNAADASGRAKRTAAEETAYRAAESAAEEGKSYLGRKPAKRMAVKPAKTEAGKPRYGESILTKGSEPDPLHYKTSAAAFREGQAVEFHDAAGECLLIATLRGDTLELRAPGNNPFRGVQFLDSSLSVSWSAANVVFVDRKRGEIK